MSAKSNDNRNACRDLLICISTLPYNAIAKIHFQKYEGIREVL